MSAPEQHWLWRLDADQWLDSAQVELRRGHERLDQRRAAITHARRGAGMALNAVLVQLGARITEPEERARLEQRWGRSYIAHLRAIADPSPDVLEPLPAEASEQAEKLLNIPVTNPSLLQLGPRRTNDAETVLAHAQTLVAMCESVVSGLQQRS